MKTTTDTKAVKETPKATTTKAVKPVAEAPKTTTKKVEAVQPKPVKDVAPVAEAPKAVPAPVKPEPVKEEPIKYANGVIAIAQNEIKPRESKLVEFIHASTDYMKYERLVENRLANLAHVKSLKESFLKDGNDGATLKVVQIVVDNVVRQFLVDGEHTRTASNEAGLPLDVKIFTLRDNNYSTLVNYIAAINSKSKNWTNNNVLEAYAKLNVPEYLEFEKVKSETKLELGDLLAIYIDYDVNYAKTLFTTGAMKFNKNRNYAELLEAVLMVKDLFPRGSKIRRAFFWFCKAIHNQRDGKTKGCFKAFAQAIIDSKIEFVGSETEIKALLEPIYAKLP